MTLMRDTWVAETRAEAVEVYGPRPELTTAYKYYWRNGLSEFRSIESEDDITLEAWGRTGWYLRSRRNAWRSSGTGAGGTRNTSCCCCVTPTREALPRENNGAIRLFREGAYRPTARRDTPAEPGGL